MAGIFLANSGMSCEARSIYRKLDVEHCIAELKA